MQNAMRVTYLYVCVCICVCIYQSPASVHVCIPVCVLLIRARGIAHRIRACSFHKHKIAVLARKTSIYIASRGVSAALLLPEQHESAS